MSKQAEEASKEIYKDGIELLGRRDRNGNLIIHPETMVGILRNACQKGYEQAEKDTIERACQYLYEYNKKMAKMFGAKEILSCSQFTIDVEKFRKTLSLEEDQ